MADWLPERLPEDLDAERAFLATCCAPGAGFSASEAVFTMREEDFVAPAHRAVFAALRGLLEKNQEVNALTLKDALDQADSLHRVGGYPGLVELLAGEDVERPMVLADLIRRKAKLRRLVHLGAQLVRQAASEEDDPEGLIAPLMTEAEAVLSSDRRAAWTPAGTSTIQTIEGSGFLTDNPRDQHNEAARFGVGLPTLDRCMKRLRRNMVVIAARPKCGKTTLMVQSAWRMARAGIRVGIASGEMTLEEVEVLLTSHALGVEQDAVAAGNLTPDQWARLEELRPVLDRIWIYAFEPGTGWAMIEATARRAIHQFALEVIYLDYFALVGKPPGQFFNEAARSAALSVRMKALPKSTGIVFVILVQINREATDSAEPSRGHIRDTGQIEQDMGLGIFLWREPTKDPLRMAQGQRWEYKAKIDGNRFGPDYVPIAFDLRGEIATLVERLPPVHETSSTTTQFQSAACGPARARRDQPPTLL